MRFRWNKGSSEQAVICMAYALICCTGISIEDAVRKTIASERHCINSNNISDKQFNKLCRSIEKIKTKCAAS